MRRLWLLFAQTVTIGLAIWFILITLKPEWVNRSTNSWQGVTTSSVASAPAQPGPGSYHSAVKTAQPSVVNIFTTKEVKHRNPFFRDPFFRRFFGEQGEARSERQSSLGSGVIVSAQGYIVTNHHVIESADEIEVALSDDRRAIAKVIGTDPETDLAVIKIDLPNLTPILFADFANIKIGDVALAIGNPYGVGQTVTMGIVSALGRHNLNDKAFQDFIQTDAAVNPGNSGGALVDANGQLIGINTAIFSQTGGSVGIGFAIPVTIVKQVLESIIKDGQVVRGWIGVQPQEITPELAESLGLKQKNGAIIAGVVRNGPADKAGIKAGDVILTVENQKVGDTREMLQLIAKLKPESKAKIGVMRKNEMLTIDIIPGKRPMPKLEEDN